MSSPVVRIERAGRIAEIILARPEKKNALNAAVIQGLIRAFEELGRESAIGAIALRGEGSDFCAGADLAEIREVTEAGIMANLEETDQLARLFLAIRGCPKVVIALVRGRALAGGCGLATACDLVLASEDAVLGYPEVRLGFVPAMVMAILRRNCGEKEAFELVTTGMLINAERARQLGLVNRVFPSGSFDGEARRFVEEMASRSTSALELIKRLFYQQDALSFEAGIRAGSDVNVLARLTEDAQAGIEGFLGRRSDPSGQG